MIEEQTSVARAKAQWEAAVDALPQLVCLVDGRGRVVRANRTLEAWGLGNVRRVEGVLLHDLLHPGCSDIHCYLARLLEQALPPGSLASVQERAFDPVLERHLHVQLTPFLPGSDGRTPSQSLLLVVLEDISSQIDAEHKAAEREQKLQLLVEFASDMIVRQKSDGTMIYVSPASESLLGFAPKALVGTNLYDLIHKEDQGNVRRAVAVVRQPGESATVTCRMRRAHGQYLWTEINSQLIANPGRVPEIVSITRDIQARKRGEEVAAQYQRRLESAVNRKTRQLGLAIDMLKRKIEINERDKAALLASERRYNMLVENTLTGIYVSEGRRLVFCNERFASIMGYRQDDMCGRDLTFLGLTRQDDGLNNNMEQEELIDVDTRSGDKKWLKLSRAHFHSDGSVYVLGNVIDITEQVHVYERLQKSEHELRVLSSQLIVAQENERKRIANELHDGIGQRLSAIKFAVEDVLRGEADIGHTAQAGRLGGIVERIRDTIEEIRRVSMDLRPSILDDLGLIATLGWFCREFGVVYQGVSVSKELSVDEADIPEPLKVVIFRITQEALHNVAKHAVADVVAIRLVQDGADLSLTISDNGAGFDYDTTVAMAAGLGLKSMRERAELTGGCFSIASGRERGTEITVRWSSL